MNTLMKNSNGFTLMEAVISLAAFMIVTLAAINLNAYATVTVERIQVRAELLENARIAMDMMTTYLKAAEGGTIVSGRLGVFRMTLSGVRGAVNNPEFIHNSTANPSQTGEYRRLNFGGNELASYIVRVTANLDEDNILTLTVITADGIRGSGITVEPVRLTSKIKLYNRFTFHR